jgi:hypothetical protein
MAKRFGHILIILLLLFGTTGMTINRHFCGKKLINASLYSTPDKCCDGDCPLCHNEKVSFRISDQFEPSQDQIDFNAGFKTLSDHNSLPVFLSVSGISQTDLLNDLQRDHRTKPFPAKPFHSGNPTAVLQVFLF